MDDLNEKLRKFVFDFVGSYYFPDNKKIDENFYLNLHSQFVQRSLGYLMCYKDFIDFDFDIFNVGIPILAKLEIEALKKVYDERGLKYVW